MARTNAGLVEGVLRRNYDGKAPLDVFIRGATLIVDRVAACAAAKGQALTAEELKEIETWLSAHAYQLVDKGFSSKNTGGASASYQGQTGMSLDATFYGQYAKMLDASGCLDALDKNKIATGFWLGKPPSEQTDYRDRD